MKTFLGIFLNSFSFVFAYRKYQSKAYDPIDITVFESDEYDFDKELDFELMGIEIFNKGGDPPPEILEKLEKYENKQTPNIEETKNMNLGTSDEPREVKIGTGLSQSQREDMRKFLHQYQDVFA